MNTQWPTLSYEDAKETYQTLHLFTQVVGKIKLAKHPWINHSWHVTFLVTPLGLTTSTIPDSHKNFEIDFDFIEHKLNIITSDRNIRTFGLKGLSVADFYFKIINALKELDIKVDISTTPCEMETVIPFEKDTEHATYVPLHVEALHHALLRTQDVLMVFRSEFNGKCSPIHFFWGSFDLAVSRFSGRKAPLHPGGIPHLPDKVVQEAYSQEVFSCGFWPGNEMVPYAALYCYIYPEPEGFNIAKVEPSDAFYHKDLREFILPYESARKSEIPEKQILAFLQSTYEQAANLSDWNRAILETASM